MQEYDILRKNTTFYARRRHLKQEDIILRKKTTFYARRRNSLQEDDIPFKKTTFKKYDNYHDEHYEVYPVPE